MRNDARKRLRTAFEANTADAPAFDSSFGQARKRLAASRTRRRVLPAVAAGVLLAAGLVLLTRPPAPGLVSDEALLGSTSWSAPSDVLLPKRRIDIYRELPELNESTKPGGGTLL